MDDEQERHAEMVLVRSSFPVTGQPVRVVMIHGVPWFVTADVCRVLGRSNPSEAVKIVKQVDSRTVDLRRVTLRNSEGYSISAGEKPYARGNPMLGVISEAGFYTLVMRSTKPNAGPFQEWVTRELLPSVRRGDTDVPTQQRRMAQTLAEAVGQRVEVVAEIGHEDRPGVSVHSDGTVHCRHGEMLFHVPTREEDSGPPFGAYFSCPAVERVGIRGSRVLPGCPKLKLVDLVRLRQAAHPGPGPEPEPDPEPDRSPVYVELHGARIYGTPPQIAELMREYGR
ncbi:Bro-N domain-containing protein [Kitasatospora sp. NPDC056181]|uniref:BRO-N domain-containing protein n=1 Tax=Kitasatospora sp. NPDC056181 TaxID=3345737 RepID=UPI0035D8DAE4